MATWKSTSTSFERTGAALLFMAALVASFLLCLPGMATKAHADSPIGLSQWASACKASTITGT